MAAKDGGRRKHFLLLLWDRQHTVCQGRTLDRGDVRFVVYIPTNTGPLAGPAVLNGTHIIIIIISVFRDNLLLLFTCLDCHDPPSVSMPPETEHRILTLGNPR